MIIGSLILFVSSCSTAPGNARNSEPAAGGEEELGATQSDDKTRVIRPNPYLENAPSINGNTRSAFDRGLAAMESENWSEAELIFQELTVTQSRLSGPWVNLGIIHYQTDNDEAAENAWNTAIDVNPMNFDAYNHLAILKREQGDFAAAEKFFLNSLAKWPDNAEAHCNLGILYDLYMGLWSQALAEYQECADLAEEPSRQLRGWIIDMERRIQSQAAE